MVYKVAVNHGDSVIDGNRLINSLPPRQKNGLLMMCESVELTLGAVLCEAGEAFEWAYFPVTGSISMFETLNGNELLETASIGREGMLGAGLILNVNRSFQKGIVQTSCLAQRIKARKLQTAKQIYPALNGVLQHYLYVVFAEMSRTVSCAHFHDVGMRLARALLQAQDRAQTDHIQLTHQALAGMLGVQRGAVTIAASKLQREGIIRYTRGKVSILKRAKLEASSCDCYHPNQRAIARSLS